MADAPNTNDELYPIAVLIDELKVRLFCALDCPFRHLNPQADPILSSTTMLSSA